MPSVERRAPTIQDVARRAGVSSATVSRALNTPWLVSEDTRARVAEAVEITGYTLNQSARSLRLREAKTILVATPNIGNPYYSGVLDAVLKEAVPRGYGVLVASRFGDDPAEFLSHYFVSHRTDGLLIFDATLDFDALNELGGKRGALPLVVSCDDLPPAPLHLVTTDNYDAARQATQYLIGLGHRGIGYIRSRTIGQMRNERMSGFTDAMRDAGLSVPPDWIFPGDFTMEAGHRAGEAFLALDPRPTAMFCANDESAIGFIAAIRAAGLDYPRDVSIVGFDDIAVTGFLTPPLTTMHQPRTELGSRAAALLLDLIEHGPGDDGPVQLMLKSELVVRGSTAPPPASKRRASSADKSALIS